VAGSPTSDGRIARRHPAARASLWSDDRPSAFGPRRDLRRAGARSASRRRFGVCARRARAGLDPVRRRVPVPARPADAERLGAPCMRARTPPPLATPPGLTAGPLLHRRACVGADIERAAARQSLPTVANPSVRPDARCHGRTWRIRYPGESESGRERARRPG